MILPELFRYPHEPVAIDTETTGLRIYQGDKILGFSVSIGGYDWYFPVNHPNSENISQLDAVTILQALAKHDVVVMHNSCFDRGVLAQAFGIVFEDTQIWDTQCGDWLMDEAADHRLKEIGARLWGFDAKAEKVALDELRRGTPVADVYRELREAENARPRAERERATTTRARAKEMAAATKRDWHTLTAADISDYAKQDTRLTLDLYHHQLQCGPIENDGFETAMAREQLVLGQCYRFQRDGILVNEERATYALEAAEDRLAELSAPWSHVNFRSTKQVQALLYDEWKLPCTRVTPAGARSTDKVALEALAYDPRVHAIQEARKLAKQIDAFYLPLIDRAGPDGRVHPSFNPNRTVTGRLACSGPNIQQVPKEGPVRALFEPAPGCVFLSADLPSAELRVMALLTGEQLWIDAIRSGADFHQANADKMGLTRKVAKTVGYALPYGTGVRRLSVTLAQGTGRAPNMAEAGDIKRAFWRGVPKVKRMLDGMAETWERRGRLPIRPWAGRYRNFTDRTGYPRPYAAFNNIVQGTIAELVKDWCLMLEPSVAALGGRIVCQVHDSIVIEVPVERAEEAKLLFQAAFDAVNAGKLDDLDWPLDVVAEF